MDFDKKAEMPQGTEAQGCDTAKVAVRAKRWDDCGLEEKVERLRTVLRFVAADASDAGKVAQKAYEVSHLHEHGGNGRPVMPIAIDPWGNQATQIIGRDYPSGRRIQLLD